jgi:putative ABC transport system permease protein
VISDLLFRVRAVFRRKYVEAELEEELRAHMENQVEKYVQSGLPAEEAQRRARLEFGGLEQVKEECRDARGVNFIETTIQDVRYGLRQLRRNPGFTAVAIITLALGIGATTAIFSVVDAVLLHGTPYQNPDQLVQIGAKSPQGEGNSVSMGDFNDWREQSQVFQGMAAYKRSEFYTATGVGDPDEVWASPVSSNLFHLLGVDANLGRSFAADETQAVVLSHDYWHSHFSSDPKIIGKTLVLDGRPYTVIGIAPSDLEFPAPNTQMWIPLVFNADARNDHEHHSLDVIARLKPGVTAMQAQTAMDVVSRRLAMQYPKMDAGWRALVEPFKGQETAGVLRAAILALLGAVVLVQMIVCTNVASMLLARGTARRGEMAVRAALGAGRLRLIRQLVVESVLLAAAAGVGGVMLARSGLAVIVSLVPKYNLVETQALHHISMNLAVFGCAAVLSLLTGIGVGLLPALRASRIDISDWLKEHGRAAAGARGTRLQSALVTCEIALALVLLVGAGLMVQSFRRLAATPTGFDPDHLLTVRVPLVKYKYSQGPPSAAFYGAVLRRIEAIPGVKSAGMANNLPFTGFHVSLAFPSPPNSPGGPGSTVGVAGRSVSPGYFQAMGTPLVEGRDFTEAENRIDAPCVRIVDQAMARLYWPGEDAVGQQLPGVCPKGASAAIVGVVADSKQDSVESQAQPELYEPYAQHPFASFLVTFAIRTASDPLDVAMAVRQAVRQVDSDQPVIQLRSMQEVISESIWRQHVSASVLGVFAAIALLLAAVGIYGVISYSISRRTHELGIRSALGATRRDVLGLVLREGLLLTLIGLVAGIMLALGLTRLLAGLLYGVRPHDPLTFAALSLLLGAVALVATYIPARRATKLDPMVALRHE